MVAWIAGVIGLAGSIAGWLIDPQAFAYALSAALILAIGWPLGSLALIHVHALTGGVGIRDPPAACVRHRRAGDRASRNYSQNLFLALLLYPWMHTDN